MDFDPVDVIDNLVDSEIKLSSLHGLGLFATKGVEKNAVLGHLDGQIVPWAQHQKYKRTLEWNIVEEGALLVRPYRTKYSYINHHRSPNLALAYAPLRVVALRDIAVGEELTLDYRKEDLPADYIDAKGKYYL